MLITLLTQFQIIDRNARSLCTHCVVTNNRVFRVCRQIKAQSETCDECWWKHKTSKCSLSMFLSFFSSHSKRMKRLLTYDVNSMRVKFAIAKVMLSIFVNINVFSLHTRDTKAYIKSVRTFLMSTNACLSQRSFNKKRRLISIIIQSTDDRERSKKSDEVDESFDNRAEIVVDISLFLFQNEKSSQSEQHDNFVDFDSDIEIERFAFESSNVVSIIERAEVSKSQLSKIDRDRASTSRSQIVTRSRVVKKSLSPFWFYFRRRKHQRTYETKRRIYMFDV